MNVDLMYELGLISDKTAATDESVTPLALGAGATVAGFGVEPLAQLLERRADIAQRYPAEYKAAWNLIDSNPAGKLERELQAAKVFNLATGTAASADEVAALQKKFDVARKLNGSGWNQLHELHAKVAKTPAARIIRTLNKVPGSGWVRLLAPAVGLGGAIYTGRQLYKRYRNHNS